MSTPLANTDQLGLGKNENFVGVSVFALILESEFEEIVGFQVPLQNQVTVIVHPDDLAVGGDHIGEQVRVVEDQLLQDVALGIVVNHALVPECLDAEYNKGVIEHRAETKNLLERLFQMKFFLLFLQYVLTTIVILLFIHLYLLALFYEQTLFYYILYKLL